MPAHLQRRRKAGPTLDRPHVSSTQTQRVITGPPTSAEIRIWRPAVTYRQGTFTLTTHTMPNHAHPGHDMVICGQHVCDGINSDGFLIKSAVRQKVYHLNTRHSLVEPTGHVCFTNTQPVTLYQSLHPGIVFDTPKIYSNVKRNKRMGKSLKKKLEKTKKEKKKN